MDARHFVVNVLRHTYRLLSSYTHDDLRWSQCWHVCTHSGYFWQGIVLTIDMYPCISWKVEGTNADMYVDVHRYFDFGVNVHRQSLYTKDVDLGWSWCWHVYTCQYRRCELWQLIFRLLSTPHRAFVDDWHVHTCKDRRQWRNVRTCRHGRKTLCSKCA